MSAIIFFFFMKLSIIEVRCKIKFKEATGKRDYCEVVVGDFGLAKLLDHKDSHVTTSVRGTVGHIAAEFCCFRSYLFPKT